MVSRACRGAPSDQGNGVPSLSRGTFRRRKWCPELVEGHLSTKEMVSRACRGAPSDKEMVSRACRGAPSDKEMVSRACRGAPSHEGNGVPNLPRGTFLCSAHVLLLHTVVFGQLILCRRHR